MKNLEIFIADEENSIREVMTKIAANAKGLVFICKDGRLLATVTDGDIRRYIIDGGDIAGNVSNAAHYSPVFAYWEEKDRAKDIMIKQGVTALPIVNHEQKLLDIVFLTYFEEDSAGEPKASLDIPVVIMAGGKGKRLKPFTDILPKPLIPLGERTVTERIITKFQEYGCDLFYMICVLYKSDAADE